MQTVLNGPVVCWGTAACIMVTWQAQLFGHHSKEYIRSFTSEVRTLAVTAGPPPRHVII